MKATVKAPAKRNTRRDLFDELSEGIAALAETRRGKRTLRTRTSAYNRSNDHTGK